MSKSVIANSYLVELGLTNDEASIYTLLLSAGSLSAKDISKQLSIIVNSVYRLTDTLIQKGLARELDVTPKQFQAVSPKTALSQLAEEQVSKIRTVSSRAIEQLDAKQNSNRLNMGLMTGRRELFECFVTLAQNAQKEILVVSVGEEVPESIWSTIKEALGRGVTAKFIFHKNDKENALLIKRWRAMGVSVRHLPREGYHLNIFDNSAAILSASNPEQTKERTGVVIYNESVIEALRTLFFQHWAIAVPV